MFYKINEDSLDASFDEIFLKIEKYKLDTDIKIMMTKLFVMMEREKELK